MSDLAVRRALEIALIALAPAIEVATENGDYTPTAKTPYAETFLIPAEPDNLGDFTRLQGVFQVDLKYPKGVGPKAAAERAELMKTVFYRGASFASGGVTVRIERTLHVMKGYNDADRWILPVRIRYFANL